MTVCENVPAARSPLLVYSELLANIKKVAVHIESAQQCSGIIIRVLDTLDEVEVEVAKAVHRASLPAKVLPVHITRPEGRSWTLRLPLAEDASRTPEPHHAPWTAVALTAETEICCHTCSSVIVSRGRIAQWKDLPSESWAEMMEFWHCHKPEEPEQPTHQTSGKGYAAAGRLQILPGVGMVDTASILLPAVSAASLEVTSDYGEVQCRTCSTRLGSVQENEAAYKIAKWQLSVSRSIAEHHETISKHCWLAHRLLQAVEDYGVRRFVVSCPASPQAVSIWIFAPDLQVARSEYGVQQVVKVMWQDITTQQATAMDGALTSQNGAVEALTFGRLDFQTLQECLQSTQDALPESMRTFQDWRVALLPRQGQVDASTP